MKSLINSSVRYLLDVFEYDTSLFPGPPHSCSKDEIQNLFGMIIILYSSLSLFFVILQGPEFKLELLESGKTYIISPKLSEINQPLDNLYFLSKK